MVLCMEQISGLLQISQMPEPSWFPGGTKREAGGGGRLLGGESILQVWHLVQNVHNWKLKDDRQTLNIITQSFLRLNTHTHTRSRTKQLPICITPQRWSRYMLRVNYRHAAITSKVPSRTTKKKRAARNPLNHYTCQSFQLTIKFSKQSLNSFSAHKVGARDVSAGERTTSALLEICCNSCVRTKPTYDRGVPLLGWNATMG